MFGHFGKKTYKEEEFSKNFLVASIDPCVHEISREAANRLELNLIICSSYLETMNCIRNKKKYKNFLVDLLLPNCHGVKFLNTASLSHNSSNFLVTFWAWNDRDAYRLARCATSLGATHVIQQPMKVEEVCDVFS